jgi:tRNA-dihydrouridine synthase
MKFDFETYKFPIVGLSPMDGVTDSPFRQLVKITSNPDIVFTEFVHVRALTEATQNVIHMLKYEEIERPIFAQIYGSNPNYFYHIAKVVTALGFDGIDINMGCPAKNVANSGAGAALIRSPEKAIKIIKATKQGVIDWVKNGELTGLSNKSLSVIQKQIKYNLEKLQNYEKTKLTQGQKNLSGKRTMIPVTVKTRIGYDNVVTTDWVCTLTKASPFWISIHGRTLKQMYTGTADWDELKKAVKATHIPVITNGDIKTYHDIKRMLDYTDSKGVLIGRASFGNPWIFQNPEIIKSKIKTTSDAYTIIKNTMIKHAQLHIKHKPDEKSFIQMRKHFGWYCKTLQSWYNDLKQTRATAGNFESVKELKIALLKVKNIKELEKLLG